MRGYHPFACLFFPRHTTVILPHSHGVLRRFAGAFFAYEMLFDLDSRMCCTTCFPRHMGLKDVAAVQALLNGANDMPGTQRIRKSCKNWLKRNHSAAGQVRFVCSCVLAIILPSPLRASSPVDSFLVILLVFISLSFVVLFLFFFSLSSSFSILFLSVLVCSFLSYYFAAPPFSSPSTSVSLSCFSFCPR